jgi:hypothetical protein
MKICANHSGYKVPLIFTFAFPGKEYWCPFCGNRGGMFGIGIDVPETPELIARLEAYEKRAADFLAACGRSYAVQTKHNGEWVKPSDLPDDVKQRDAELRVSWEYEKAI